MKDYSKILKFKRALDEIASLLEDQVDPYKTASTVMRSTEDLLKYSIKRIGSKTKENLLVCYMNSKLQLIHAEVISIGTVNSALVHPREVFRLAVKLSASQIFVAHNHPSGNITPSDADMLVARRLIDAGRVLGIEVLDNVVVSRTSGKTISI